MRNTKINILNRLKKNDLSFYCLLTVLSLSVICGFVFSVTVQTISFFVLIICFSIIFIKKSFKNKSFLLIFLPLAAVLLSYIGADFQVNVRNVSLGFFNAITAFFIISHSDAKNKENILLAFLFLGLWVSFLLFVQVFTGSSDIEQTISLNINIISGFLLLVYPLALGFTEKNKNPLVFLFIAFVIFAAIIFTKSRTAIVLSYAVTVFYFINMKNSKNLKIFFILISSVVIAGIIYAFHAKTGWNSLSERLIWWKTALLMFKDYPIFGIGFGNYGALFLYYRPEPVLNTLFAHNVFLQLLAETGIAGLICFVTTFFFIAKNAVRSFKVGNADSVYMKSVAISVISFLIFNITEYSFYIPVCLMAFFVLCGFLCSLESQQRKKRLPYLIALPVLFAVYMAVPPAVAEQYYNSGKNYAANKDYSKAKEQYLKAVKYDKKNPEYLHQVADSSFRLYVLSSQTEKSYLEDTITFESQSEKFFKHSAQIKSGLANLYNLKGDVQNAQKYADAALKADKFNPYYRKSK